MRHRSSDEQRLDSNGERPTAGGWSVPGITRRQALQAGAVAVGSLGIDAASAHAEAAAPEWQRARSEVSFDENWSFFRGDETGAQAPSFDDSSWRTLDVPHDWSIEDLPYATSTDGGATADPSLFDYTKGPTTSGPTPPGVPEVIGPFDHQNSAGQDKTGYTVGGVGWYRKHFEMPDSWSRHAYGDRGQPRQHVEVRFDGVYEDVDVWLNGQHLGFHPYGYTPFVYDLTPFLNFGGSNVLAVRVDNSGKNSRWYAGSGIYRHTWLTTTGPVRIPTWGVFVNTPTVGSQRSVAHVEVQATNLGTTTSAAEVVVTLLGPNGRALATRAAPRQSLTPASTATYKVDIPVWNAALWSPESPTLYQARTDVLIDGRLVDSTTTTFGIRSLEWNGTDGFLLNGTATKVRGACIHSSHGPMGAVALARSDEREIEVLKAAGFNAIRTAHNPPSPEALDACDRLGMLVWDEYSDIWDAAKNPDDYHLYFLQWWQRDLTSMIVRDRNHPSVVIWSLGNEIGGFGVPSTPTDVTLDAQMVALVHSLDQTRPVSQGARPLISVDDQEYQYMDVVDFHYDLPSPDPIALHAAYPSKAVTQSESWPANIYDDWTRAQDNAWFVGSWSWVGWDYLGESGSGAPIYAPPGTADAALPPFGTGLYPWFQDFQGDIDLIGQRKPQNYWRSVIYGFSPIEMMVERPPPAGTQQFAHFWAYYDEQASWNWDVPAGQVMTVHVYTTGDTVKLLLNGEPVATNSVAASDKRVSTFTVPYTPGKLTAIATQNGREIGRQTLKTTGAAAKLRLVSDVEMLTTGRDDLAHVLVEVLDSRGRRVPDAVVDVSFDVAGVGELVGVGNGNPHNIDSFKRPGRYTWHGQALAIVRPAKTPGQITLTATAPGLQSATLTLRVAPAFDSLNADRTAPRFGRRARFPHAVSTAFVGAPVLLIGALLRRRLAQQDGSRDDPAKTHKP